MKERKFILARKLYRKYGQLKTERYNQYGCCDPKMKMYSRIYGMCANILHRHGWTCWI